MKVDISDQVWLISSKMDVIRSSDIHSCSLACKGTLVFEIVLAFNHFPITSSSMQSINFQTFFLSSPLFSIAGALLVITALALSSPVHSFQHFAQRLISSLQKNCILTFPNNIDMGINITVSAVKSCLKGINSVNSVNSVKQCKP